MITKFKVFEESHFHTMKQIDEILDKISESGLESLEPSEMLILMNYSKDDEYIHEILVNASETAKELKKLDRLLQVITKNDTKEVDKISKIWNELNMKMEAYNGALAYLFKIEDPDDIKTYLQQSGIGQDLLGFEDDENNEY